jgi:hypothetical protein
MQCLTDLIFFLVVVDSMFMNLQSALLYRYFRQCLKSDQQAFEFLQPCQIQNSSTPLCSKLWSLPKMILSFFKIWATLHCKLFSMHGELQWMKTRSGLFLGIIRDLYHLSESTYTAERKQPAALATYVSFVMMFLAIHDNMGPAQWGNTCWQRLTSQSETNWQRQKLLNWLVQRLMKQL